MIYFIWVVVVKNTKDMFDVSQTLKSNFYEKLKDDNFKKIVDRLKVNYNKLYKHTSLLENAKEEMVHCLECRGLVECKNELKGYRNTPVVDNEDISFTYEACRYKNKELKSNEYKKNLSLFEMPEALKNAKMKDIYVDDKSRAEVIKYIDKYYNNYPSKELKGLYLHGNFGSGKTYLIAALFNELAKKGIKSSTIYFPEFLRTLKASFAQGDDCEASFSEKYEYIKKAPLLLIDDIGAENVTAWGRDEILGTLLQYRMNEKLPTFFTSNLTIDELESHLSFSNKKEERVKARRIVERIKSLSLDIELIGKSRR